VNIATVIKRWADRYPEREAVVCGERRVTYRELDRRIVKAVKLLAALGIGKNDRVALVMDNSIEFLEIYFALTRIGAWCVPLNTRLTTEELTYFLNHCGALAVVYDAAYESKMRTCSERSSSIAHFVSVGTSAWAKAVEYAVAMDAIGEERLIEGVEPSLDDVQAIMYTSGSTSQPKGAILTNGNWLWNAMAMSLMLSPENLFVNACAIPLFHTAGVQTNTFPTLMVGGKVVLIPTANGFDATVLARAIEVERVRFVYMAPTMWSALAKLENLDSYDFTSLSLPLAAGGVVAGTTVKRLAEVLEEPLLYAYGLTEAAPLVTVLTREDALLYPGSVGKPAVTVDVRVVDDKGEEVPMGEVGEITVRGPNVFNGYFNNPEATTQGLRGGWLYTGDLGRFGSAHELYFVDRKKDMIKSGGQNVYAAEVEEVLTQHPDVMQAAVIGVPDEKWSEAVTAVVVLRPGSSTGEKELIEHCRARMASYKKPQRIIFVEELPTLATGKVDKIALRRSYA
jgi:acyl-CoA synthetase (AMP-forming)/AMP-acid ligase II